MMYPPGSVVCSGTALSARASHEQGYSVVELLISTLLMTMLLGGLYSVLFQSQAISEAQQDDMALRQQARVAINALVPELRMAGFGLGNLTEAIEEAVENRLVFVADVDNGSASLPCGAGSETPLNGGAERVTYRRQGSDLLRSVDCWNGAAWTNEYTDLVVATNLIGADPVFRYYDQAGVELVPGGATLNVAGRAAVRMVGVDISLEDPGVQVVGEPLVGFRLATRITLRNRGS